MDYEDLNGEAILYDTQDAYLDDYEDDYEDNYEDDDYEDDYEDGMGEDYEDDLSERRRWRGRRNRRRTRRARGARGTRMNRINKSRYRGKGVISTPAGKAKVSLPPNLVSKNELKALEAKVMANNKAILKNGKAVGVLNSNTKRLDDGLASQGRSVNGLKKNISGIQQGQMFSALLPPKLEKVKLFGDAEIDTIPKGEDAAIDVKVKSASFDSLSSLLPMMVSGGMGGSSGSSSNNMNMMLPMVLLLNKDKDSSDDKDNTLLIVMMMMMMNNK